MTKHPRPGFLAVVAFLVLALPLLSFAIPRQMEAINRGLVVSNVGKGMLVSWRLLGTDDPATEFNLYRDGTKIATIGKTVGTNYLDTAGKVTSKYSVAAVVNGAEGAKKEPSLVFDSTVTFGGKSFPYKVLKLDRPPEQKMPKSDTTCRYFPHDMSAGDLDGDGEYELVVKWDPHNFRDNSVSGADYFTGPVFLDAYKLDGTRLWRVNLGKNIRAGAHYTQFQVFDYDGDGKAEMIVKTADGTVDGLGKVIGDASKDYRNDSGTVLTGPEYLTVFRGSDGAAITTIDYVPSRSIREFGREDTVGGTTWGDTYGNRCERYLAATAYLDGVHPSAIFARGYYTAAYVVAFDFDGKNLKQRWFHKSETPGKGLYKQGNHSIYTGDIDGDGFDEIIYGGAALNHDGTLRYSTGFGHGDAGHLGDFDPDRPGLEYFGVHEYLEQAKYMDELRAPDGSIIMGATKVRKDNGRGIAADVDSANRGFEFWSSQAKVMRTVKGDTLKADTNYTVTVVMHYADSDGDFTYDYEYGVPINFRIYFDGDLQDELLDGPILTKFDDKDRKFKLLLNGAETLGLAGGLRNYPLFVADILGDWREELFLRSERDSSKVYIISTPFTSPYRVYTLMHDPVYREAIAWQNTGYNQPPHLSYYLPDMVKKLQKPAVYTVGENEYAEYPDAVLTKTGKASETQTVTLGESITALDYSYMFCTGVQVDGLPSGVSAKVDSAANTLKIAGTPTKAGTFKFSVTTVGSKAKNVSLNGEITVKDTVTTPPVDTTKVDTTKTDTTKVDTTKTDTTKVDTTKTDTTKVDTTKTDTTKVDTTKTDTTKVDTTKTDTTKIDTTKTDTTKVDTTKTDTTKVDTTKTDTVKVDSTKKGTSIVDASKPSEGKGTTETVSEGYIGNGYFDFENSKSSYATWIINSKKKTAAVMSIRYANGDNSSRDMVLVVNDKVIGTVKLDPTGDWSIWEMADMNINLKEGQNAITLKSTLKIGGPDIDAFLFDVGGVEAYGDKSALQPVVHVNEKFFYRPSTGVLYSTIPGFVEIQFYDASGSMRGAISAHVTPGESVLAPEQGMLSGGLYFVKVKLDGKLKQKGIYKR